MSGSVSSMLFDGLVAFVEGKLPEYLAAIEEDDPKNVSLPMFKTVQRGYRDIFSLRAYDGIMFVPSWAERRRADRDAEVSVYIVMAHAAKDPETITDRQLRYADALVNLITEHPRLGGVSEHTTLERPEFLPASPGAKEIGATTVRVTVRAHYDRNC